jgi:phage regulator Rha-like protein
MKNLSIVDTNELTMGSREIAQLTGKRHSDVKRDIRRMLEELEIDVSKFAHIYKDHRNREQSEYLLPKNLTLNLITGYRADIRLTIIDRWIELETKPLSPGEMLVAQAHKFLEHERRLALVETRQESVEQHLEQLNPDTGYRTITAHCKINKRVIPIADAQHLGQMAADLCKKQRLRIGKIPDERFGSVNSYPVSVLDEVFRSLTA